MPRANRPPVNPASSTDLENYSNATHLQRHQILMRNVDLAKRPAELMRMFECSSRLAAKAFLWQRHLVQTMEPPIKKRRHGQYLHLFALSSHNV